MVMTTNVIKIFSEKSKLIKFIYYTLKNNMIRFLLKGIDAKNLITEKLRKRIKKTLLDYIVMTPNVIKLFSEHSNLFNYIHYTLKNNMIRFLLKGIDARNLITEELRKRIKDNYPVLDIIRLTQIRHLNKIYKKEDEKMDSSIERRRVWALVKSAEQVKHKIGIKKAQGIAYRLLNSVRSNDKNTFMDTVMRVYISSDLEMPGLLLEALHEDKMDFATVGNAWIAGLVSKPKDNEEGEERDE